jgi:predicted dithiol-disulfide oxidoreductase (DUF899 family)
MDGMTEAHVGSRAEWLEARRSLLAREKELTRLRDEIAAARRALPWVRVDKPYVFDTEAGPRTLAELFDGRSQLLVYHFMFAPDWDQACPSCSFLADHIDGARWHLGERDVTLIAASRAPLAKLMAFRARMGWKFPWVSAGGSDFNYDFGVSFRTEDVAAGAVDYNYGRAAFPVEEAHGLSAFCRDGGAVFHTYSTYGRGVDMLLGTYNYLDLAPKGRDEDALPWTMSWVRYHDTYGPAG